MTSVLLSSTLLKTARKKQHLTQADMAKKLGVSLSSIKYWETGRRTPKEYLIVEIANAYGVKINELRASITNLRKFRKETK